MCQGVFNGFDNGRNPIVEKQSTNDRKQSVIYILWINETVDETIITLSGLLLYIS